MHMRKDVFFSPFSFNQFFDINYTFDPNKSLDCPPCNFKPTNYNADSTPNDVIFGYISKNVSNLLPFLRTLRSTGSKCSTVFFIDDEALSKIGPKEMSYIERCGAQFVNIHRKYVTGEYAIFSEIYLHIYNFLYRNRHKINRVIKIDMYDALFQGDPFNEFLPKNALHLVPETGLQRHTKNEYVLACGIKIYSKYYMVCAGYFGGDVESVYRYAMFYVKEWKEGNNDQGCMNGWMMSGQLEKYGIKVNNSKESNILHMYWFGRDNKEFGDIRERYRKDKVASIIHHTHFFKHVLDSVEDKYCPPPYPDFPNYISQFRFNRDL